MGYMKELDIRIRNGGDDAIAAVSELMPRWIPVTERLPDEGVEVLWYSSHDRFARWATGKRDGGLVDWGGDLESEIEGWLTHWMPLPAPPTDGK